MSYTDLDGMIAAIADEHLNGARWAVLLFHMLLGPVLQAWQTLHTMEAAAAMLLPIAMFASTETHLTQAVCLALQVQEWKAISICICNMHSN